MNFGKSKARLVSKDTPKVTFADVAGVDEAIEELEEIKDFLKSPEKFQAVGAKIEVWVADDTSFPAGDCRGAASTVITQAQVDAYHLQAWQAVGAKIDDVTTASLKNFRAAADMRS